MRADIVNPGAPVADRYSRWEEYVAVHRMIQNANAPGVASPVNFGHGGSGAYGFFPWHRYFLLLLEQQLQTYVPGVALPYWDWTDPVATIMVADFLGPDGDSGSGDQVRQGYFAAEAPGTGVNLTPAPAWWPAGLTGFTLHSTFGAHSGPLRRNVGGVGGLPSMASVRSALDKVTYPTFQAAVEAGTGTVPFHGLHNTLHTWFGIDTHMRSTIVSPFDPMFYLHHCNIDRLWAMWQADGHALEYPVAGGAAQHHLTDPMYPWVGALAGYSSNFDFAPIVMPDFSALGVVTPADVLDHRALGYTYDSLAVVGVALDRTGSMLGMTPDPMTVAAPDVTKWEAAKRGVSAFLQDCEAAYQSAEAYVVAGVKTFRRTGGANDFSPVFAGTPYGLVKAAGAYSEAAFDAAIAPLAPGGSTPLADALVDTHATLVMPPFGAPLAGERRYLALLTDGMSNAGTAIADVADASLASTTVFAMGFGTGADVDYPTLTALIAKGQVATTPFHGENAGVIDKFYSQSLASALGFTPIMDPVFELSDGEHVHLGFMATSADETFFITAQGMDFSDPEWAYQLIAPDGAVVYADGGVPVHAHGGGGAHPGARSARATARRGHGRLSLFVQRDSADAGAWVGEWMLVIARRALSLDAMVMFDPGELMLPIAAGPARGPRYARLLARPDKRRPARAIAGKPRHRLDVRPTATARSGGPACSVVVNVYARTRLRVTLTPPREQAQARQPISLEVETTVLRGAASGMSGVARLVAPAQDHARLVRSAKLSATAQRATRLKTDDRLRVDSALVLAHLEGRSATIARTRDQEVAVVSHHGGPLHAHVQETDVPGAYHVGMIVEGTYRPGDGQTAVHHAVHPAQIAAEGGERFVRVLSTSVGISAKRPRR
jgi:hypothetical protein